MEPIKVVCNVVEKCLKMGIQVKVMSNNVDKIAVNQEQSI